MKLRHLCVSCVVFIAAVCADTSGMFRQAGGEEKANVPPTLSFSKCPLSSVGSGPSSIAMGDFDNNGTIDLVTANQGNGMISVLYGDGAGGFGGLMHHSSGGVVPVFVLVGQFNTMSDSLPDIAVANQGNMLTKGNLSILLNNGSGDFPSTPTSYMTNDQPHSIAKGLFGTDTHTDLALATIGVPNVTDGNVETFLGHGTGTFDAAVDHVAGDQPHAVAIADFTSDNIADILVANGGSVSTPPPPPDHQLTLLVGTGGGFL